MGFHERVQREQDAVRSAQAAEARRQTVEREAAAARAQAARQARPLLDDLIGHARAVLERSGVEPSVAITIEHKDGVVRGRRHHAVLIGRGWNLGGLVVLVDGRLLPAPIPYGLEAPAGRTLTAPVPARYQPVNVPVQWSHDRLGTRPGQPILLYAYDPADIRDHIGVVDENGKVVTATIGTDPSGTSLYYTHATVPLEQHLAEGIARLLVS